MMRLAVGLADEGVRILRAVPFGSDLDAPGQLGAAVLGEPIEYAPRGLPGSTPARARALLKQLNARLPANDRSIDVVHVFGGAAWDISLEIARQLDAWVMLEFWRSGLARRVRPLIASQRRLSVCAPDSALLDELPDRGQAGDVRVTPWGVYARREAVESSASPTSLVLCASGMDRAAVTMAFQAAAELIKDFPDLRYFVDARTARRTDLWSRATGLGVVDRLSLVDTIESHRDLVLKCDLLMLPEALGEHRSITLDAMAQGVSVIASRDPMVRYLNSGDEVRLVEQSSLEEWKRCLSSLLSSPVERATLAKAAQGYIARHHRASAHVAAVLGAYEAAVHEQRTSPR